MKLRCAIVLVCAQCALLAPTTFAQSPGGDREAVTAAALDYIEGYFSGDAARMERALHPELRKIIVQAPREGMGSFIRGMGSTELVEITRSKRGAIPREQWGIEVTVLDIHGTSACVKIVNPKFYDYLQLAKIDGQWKIVNVLWGYPPAPDSR